MKYSLIKVRNVGYWTAPGLYLTDYTEALGFTPHPERQRFIQIGLTELQALWQQAPKMYPGQQIQICPQCALRPATTREMAIDESTLDEQELCKVCSDLCNEQAFKERRMAAEELFGINPKSFNLQQISQQRNHSENGRMLMLSIQVDAAAIISGEALITQLARPIADLEENRELHWSANALGDALEQLLRALRSEDEAQLAALDPAFMTKIAEWMGDKFWLSKDKKGVYKIDGRSLQQGKFKQALDVAEQLFLREAIPEGLGLYRHDGDRLALFAQRKHASPARLQRLWDDLEQLWRELMQETAAQVDHQLMPVSLDARGVRFMVAASDASEVLLRIQQRLLDHFSKVRGGLPVHISAIAMRAKFPLYIALNAIYRLERRENPRQTWTLTQCRYDKPTQFVYLDWKTPQGEVSWQVNMHSGDAEQIDRWHSHVVLLNGPEGPNRLVRVDNLQVGDQASIPVSTFDFLTLEGSARRFDIHYDEQGRRPHLILGSTGKTAHLLEQLPEIVDPKHNWAAQTGWDSSRLKGLYGRMVETYDHWVRLAVTEQQRATGALAWREHINDLLARYLPGTEQAVLRTLLLAAIEDGRFFDAVEWNTYICKSSPAKQNLADSLTQD